MTETSTHPESERSGAALEWEDPSALPVEEVRELFVVLAKALRAQQLYDENNPVYQRFVGQLAEALADLWKEVGRLEIVVEEDRFVWLGEKVYENPSRTDSLAFLLYKDGIRAFTFHPGLEGEELPDFLHVLNRARDLRPEGEDLLTILWERDFQFFTYSYVDVLAEGISLPEAGEGYEGSFESILEEEMGEEGEEAGEEGAPAGQISTEDFNPTLYSLDPAEMEQIRAEIELEMARDVRGDTLAALFDRVEEPRFPERQQEILELFRSLIPTYLGRGALSSAASILEEIARLLASQNALQPEQRALAEEILDEVSGAEALEELLLALEDGTIAPDPDELGSLLRHLRGEALEPLLRGAERVKDRSLKEVLRRAVGAIADRHRNGLLRCMASEDPAVAAEACVLAGQMRIVEAAPEIAELIYHEAPQVRLAAVKAAAALGIPAAVNRLEDALEDEDGEVRIAAARALGSLKYRAAAEAFRRRIRSKELRQADLSEQIAVFEGYGLLADPEGVELLDGLLNGRGFLSRKESPEIRACAALALGKMRIPAARAALEKATREQDPVVRSAVGRALREEEG